MEYGTPAEKKALQTKSGNWGLGTLSLALVSVLGRRVFLRDAVGPIDISLTVAEWLVALTWLVGCGLYARSKGWPFVVGVLGLATCVGVVVLVLLPDKWAKALRQAPVGSPSGPPDLTNDPR